MKIAVVTGASSGIGEATARELARRGWRPVLVARRQDRLERLATELGGEYEVCDVSDRADVDRAAAAILQRHPRIDLLVNNAGIPGRGTFFSLEPERIEAVLRTNYLGGVWMVRALEAALQPGAHVVNVVSVAGTVAFAPAGPTQPPSTRSWRSPARSPACSRTAACGCTRCCRASSRRRGSHRSRYCETRSSGGP